MSGLRVHILDTGYTDHWGSIAVKGAPHQKIRFPATVAVIEHPINGIILFDTGYSPRFFEQTKHFPEKLYALVTPVHVTPELTAVEQLKKMGIQPKEVRAILLSHFHADHIAGISDFPQATYFYRAEAYEDLKNRSRFGQVRSGFLRGLLPEDFAMRAKGLADTDFTPIPLNLPGFERAHDFFGDGSLFILDLPGHVAGHTGILIHSDRGPVFLVGDACWSNKAVTHGRLPPRFAGLVFSDWKTYADTIFKISQVHSKTPEIKILPCHCEEAHVEYQRQTTESASFITENRN